MSNDTPYPSEGVFNSATIIQAHRLYIKVAELNTHQMEMELQAYLVQFFAHFFNEMGNKKTKKWEIKKLKNGK